MSVQFIDYGPNNTQSWGPEQYKGAVLDTYEVNGYDDSDWYAIVWDDEKKIVRTVEYDTTRAAAMGKAWVDATPYAQNQARQYAAQMIWDNLVQDHKVVAPGKAVKSLTTRGKAKGAVGTVVRFENSKFDSAWAARYSPTKVAVVQVTDPKNVHCGRNVYVAPDKLEVTEELTPDVTDRYRKEAKQYARSHGFMDLFHGRWGKVYRVAELYR